MSSYYQSSNPVRRAAAILSLAAMLMPSPVARAQNAQQPTSQQTSSRNNKSQGLYTFKANAELVLVSVTARDKHGNIIRDLKQSDFTVLEDGKAQHIQTFDVEDAQSFASNGPAQLETQGAPAPVSTGVLTQKDVASEQLRDRRLIVLFFDLSSMEPDELNRAMNSARHYVDKQMTPADLVSVVSFDTALEVRQDFTSDHDALKHVFDSIQGIEGEGMANGTTGDDEGTPDTGGAYTPDDTDYNTFNTDRRLQAIASVAQVLGRINQKKALLYFSGGIEKTGIDNQVTLRAAINTAVKANVSIYAVDTHGLDALPPTGSAQTASLRGTAAYNGRAVQSQFDTQFAQQETISTISQDTGGKVFLDTNDFSKAFEKVQADTSTYYVLGYRSTNIAMDGHFRRISVKSNRPDVKLEYRSGYYGPRDFKHFTKEDRENQLDEEMLAELPNTDVPVYLSAEVFRARDRKMFVPVSVVVPGSAIPFTQASDADKASIDILGVVRERQTKIVVGQVRETVKLNFDTSKDVKHRNVQYNTAFELLPGSYHLKFVVRENANGRLGSFESDLDVPALDKQQLKMSTVVLASQRTPMKKGGSNPLVKDGQQIVPNVAHVFANDQPVLFYYEVYDPAKPKPEQNPNGEKSKSGAIHVLTNIQFFRGKVKVYETPLVEARELNAPDRKAASFELEVPASQLKPGWYTCQVNVIDDAAGTFTFPRVPLLVR
jgi:VWFA-related protein